MGLVGPLKNRHTKAHKGSNLDESMDTTILQDEFDTDDETEPLPDQDRFDTMPVYSCMKSFIKSAYPFEEVSDQISTLTSEKDEASIRLENGPLYDNNKLVGWSFLEILSN